MLKRPLLSAAFAATVAAQTTSSITGVFQDQSKAVIPGAQVVVTAIETGFESTTQANSDGYYTAASLLAMKYKVSAEAPGLKKAVSARRRFSSATGLATGCECLQSYRQQYASIVVEGERPHPARPGAQIVALHDAALRQGGNASRASQRDRLQRGRHVFVLDHGEPAKVRIEV